jgi:hypothetical protein
MHPDLTSPTRHRAYGQDRFRPRRSPEQPVASVSGFRRLGRRLCRRPRRTGGLWAGPPRRTGVSETRHPSHLGSRTPSRHRRVALWRASRASAKPSSGTAGGYAELAIRSWAPVTQPACWESTRVAAVMRGRGAILFRYDQPSDSQYVVTRVERIRRGGRKNRGVGRIGGAAVDGTAASLVRLEHSAR